MCDPHLLPPPHPDDGWSLVEVLIAVAIVLMMSATVGQAGLKQLERARSAAVRVQISAFTDALQDYAADCGSPPPQAEGLRALWIRPSGSHAASWRGPYVAGEIPLDPWGNEYRYHVPGPNGLPWEILSLGSDGAPGGVDSAADILSWRRVQ